MRQEKELWIDTRLTEKEMNFLWSAISSEEENKKNWNHDLAGNISKSELIKDKDNWFYETVLKELSEKMFYRNCRNYYEDYIENEPPLPPEFKMNRFWVNYMKQHEFNPLHGHSGLFSFVVFLRIPTHWKEQHALPFSAGSNSPFASDFAFVWPEKDSRLCEHTNFQLSPEDEGRMLFFPATLQHMVYPFYECEEERVTISGNIDFEHEEDISKRQNISKKQEKITLSGDVYEDKVKMLEMMENNVKIMKEELNID